MRYSALAQAISQIPVRQDYIPMQGGLDITTAPIARDPGTLRAAQNFEQSIYGGYRRIAGYERYSGKPAPSDATYSILTATITGAPAVGNTITGVSSGHTGVIIALPGGAFVITKATGIFNSGETINISGSPVATTTATAVQNGASTPLLHATYLNAAADVYRTDIAAPTGAGNCLGGFYFNNVNYCFRNNAGSTAANLWKSTASGWSQVAFEYEIAYTVGSGSVDDGDTLTQGGVTATIRRVLIRTGTLAGGTAAGILVISVPAGGNFGAGAATTTGGGTLSLTAIQAAITLLPDGRFEAIKENFGGAANATRVYGCDGINRGWEFDGSYFVPIPTGMTADTPKHVFAHKKHLFFSFLGSVQHSGPGAQFAWTPVLGGAEIGMGDTVTGFAEQPGNEVGGGALAIFTRNRLSILYGSSAADWNLVAYRDELGAYDYTIQDAGFTVFLDDRGLTDIQTSQAYGNFAHNAFSNRIKDRVSEFRLSAISSVASRDRSQYRIFFTNNYGFYVTVVGRKIVGIMQVLFVDIPRVCWTAEKNDGTEVMFFGSNDGLVYQMEKGTSFDGDNIEFYIDCAYNFQKSPRVEKQYHDVSIEVEGSAYAAFQFGYSLGYGSTDIPQPVVQSVTTNFSSVYWDSFTFDAAVWDGITLAPSNFDCPGSAENISLAVRGISDIYEPFTITGAIVHYSPRRRLRP